MSRMRFADFSQSQSQLLTVQTVRTIFLCVALLGTLGYQLTQVQFISYEFYFSLYALIGISFLLNLGYVVGLQYFQSLATQGAALLFIWDTFYVTLLTYVIGVNQSLLIFLYLINIILCGIVFQRRGGIFLALLTSFSFGILLIADPIITGKTLYLAVGINNLAFFAVAYLSGYLSEQLNFMGVELLERGRDLRALKNLNSLIIDGMPSGLLTIDSRGTILQFNQQAAEILNQNQALLNKNINELIPPLKDLLARWRRDGKGDGRSEEATTIDQKIVRLSFSPLFDEKSVRLGSIVLIDDVTNLKRLENQVHQSEKLAAIGQLAAGIAHEIRNPLASISGSVQLMQADATQTEENQKLMAIAIKEINRLNHLITEFLDYARPADFQKEKVNLSHTLSECLDSLRSHPLMKNVQVESRIAEHVQVMGNSDKLKQVFLNILVNALQAMEAQPVCRLKVELTSHGGRALLKIADSGVGMNEAQQKKMFEPFHTTKSKGTGLGLAIVHAVLQAHDVAVDVQSKLGSGTEFSMTFHLS